MNDASITTMKDPEGNVLYPKTRTDAVYDSSSNRLDQTISDMDSDISSLQSDLGSKSSASAVTGNDAFSKISTLNSDLTNKAKVQKLHSANTITIAFTNSLAVVPWSTLDNLDRTKYNLGPVMCSCGGSDGVLCASFRFDDTGITLWSSKPSYTGNIQLQVYAILIAK